MRAANTMHYNDPSFIYNDFFYFKKALNQFVCVIVFLSEWKLNKVGFEHFSPNSLPLSPEETH